MSPISSFRSAVLALTIITLVGLVEQDDLLPHYVLPFSIIGIGVSGYHYLIQIGLFGNVSACSIGIPCNLRYVNYFGFVTIPFLALTAFVLITIIMLATRRAHSHTAEEDHENGIV